MQNRYNHRPQWWATAAALAALACAAPAHALTEAECFWDVGAQASTNELAGVIANPAGQWSYLWQPGSSGAPSEYAAGTPTLYTTAEHTNDWYSQSNSYLRGFVHNVGDNVPMVVTNTSPDPGGQNTVYGAHVNFAELLVHPGQPAAKYDIVRFTAPATGTFNIVSKWRIAHGASVVWGVFRNHGTLVATGTSDAAGNGFSGALALTAGETLDFAIGLAGSGYGGATTGIVVKVTRQDTSCPGQCADANNNGVCDQYDISKPVDLCANVNCSASDQCHDAGTCNPANGTCSNPAKANGVTCNDGNACTTGDSCQSGTCQAAAVLSCDDNNVCTADACDPNSGCVNGASVTVGNGNNYSTTVGTQAPLAYWSMDQTSGAMTDTSGNGHHASASGLPQYNQPSLLPSGAGKAVRLNGSGRFITAPFQKFSAGSTGYTMSYWVKINSIASTYTQAWGDGNSDGSGQFYMMQYLQNINGASACPRPHFGSNLGGWDPSPCTVGANIAVGVPTHIVITWDRTLGTSDVWVDNNHYVMTGKPTGIPSGTGLPMILGYDNREPAWDITLDEVAFWDRPLSTTEVQAQNTTATVAPGTPCDDGNACTQSDLCDNGTCVGGNPVVCSASDQCHSVGTCDGSSGVCSNPAKANGSTCTDGNACTISDACQSGACATGAAANCDDGSACTADSCNPASGCVNALIDADGDGIGDCVDNCGAKANSNQADADGDGSGDACDVCLFDSANDADGDGVCGQTTECSGGSGGVVIENVAKSVDGFSCITTTPDYMQSFTATTGSISGAALLIGSWWGSNQVTLKVYNAPLAQGGQVIASGTGNALQGQWLVVNWTAVSVTPGQVYHLAWTSASNNCTATTSSYANTYAGGMITYQGVDTGWASNYDIGFRIYGAACSTPDNCPTAANADQADNDGDGQGDACDSDDDNDSVADATDNCQWTANADQADNEADGQGDACDGDDDNDSVLDASDNCPTVSNADQANNEADGQGDACDSDDDNDSIADSNDNCAFAANTDQADNDADGQGDTCDGDDDNDGVADGSDNCVSAANADQADLTGDGEGDACDADDDDDGVADASDNCPAISNVAQADQDGDSIGDLCDLDVDGDTVDNEFDNCLTTANADQADNDGDTHGDLCDDDDDNDGVADGADNCAFVANTDQANNDGDSEGDLCDADDDNDTVADGADNCALIANSNQQNTDGDLLGDACDPDLDGDGVVNVLDNCAAAANGDQADLDLDGQGDACDGDLDGDGVVNGLDNCPAAANGTQIDQDADGLGDACDPDIDGDGISNTSDNCWMVSNSDQVNTDGDAQGNACDDDDDNDTVLDGADNCSLVANSSQLNTDGDSQGDACDADDDNDGVADGSDLCAASPAGAIVDPANGCSIPQLCPCAGPRGTTLAWKDHGKYVECVEKSVKTFKKKGLISCKGEGSIVSLAGQSSCGKKPKKADECKSKDSDEKKYEKDHDKEGEKASCEKDD